MYIVSACLAGLNTRYDGKDALDERVRELVAGGRALPVCPEQLAGLGTPRAPVEFSSGSGGGLLEMKARAVGSDGVDYTEAFIRGAREVLRLARLYGIEQAVMKDGSPSCGVTYVYSGGSRCDGRGVCAELLAKNGIKVMTVDSLC